MKLTCWKTSANTITDENGQPHAEQRREPENGNQQDQNSREDQQNGNIEVVRQRCADHVCALCIDRTATINEAEDRVHDEADDGGRNGRIAHGVDMVIQTDLADASCQVCCVRKGRHLIAEIGAAADRTDDQREPGRLVVEATPTRARPIVAIAPNDVPVKIEVRQHSTNVSGSRIAGEISFVP